MLIDHPHQGRDLALNFANYFTHPGADGLFTELASYIDRYAEDYRTLANSHREEQFADKAEAEAGGKHA